MKINELRVGNLIEFCNGITKPEITKVDVRFFSSFAGGRASNEFKDDEEISGYYKGIPLTEDWLKRFGFEQGEYGWFRKRFHTDNMMTTEVEEFSINVESNRAGISFVGYIDCDFKKPSNVYFSKEILYVHTLQNAYYAVAGEELTLKETE